MVNDLHVIFGKGPGALAVPNDTEGRAPMWKKKSIFWDLPYWKDLEVRSSIDVMHVTTLVEKGSNVKHNSAGLNFSRH